ncbi:hypothetical protein [Streptomyces flaveolus]|uniref:hypothetical protein n=1 Tax=Streptomyces flaveolus TaxID=67297 RepID=UPI0033256C5A
MTGGGLLELAPGSGLLLNGVCWIVEEVLPQTGQVRLRDQDGECRERSIRWLMHRADARPAHVSKARSPDHSGQPAEAADLSADQLARARLRAEHVLEAETGYRMGDASRALPGEPRSAYDPLTTAVTERRRAKAAELQALDRDEAARLGLARMSVRTLERLAATGLNEMVMACGRSSHAARLWLEPSA